MILRDATPSQRDEVLGQTHALWADGLDPNAYVDLVATLMSGDWARAGGYRFLILCATEGGQPAAALKLYRFQVRLEGALLPAGGVGAVFTPPAARGRGHASLALRLAHDLMRARGDLLSLLFSEIGAAFYARLGYAEAPLAAGRLLVPPPPRPESAGPVVGPGPATEGGGAVRRFSRADLPLVQRLRERADAAAPLSLARDHDYLGYLLARASYPTLYLGRRMWESRVTLAGDRGYLWALLTGEGESGEARLLELAEEAPGAAAPRLLDELLAECRRRGMSRVACWTTDAAGAEDPRLREGLEEVSPAAVVPMWLALRDDVRDALERSAVRAAFHAADLF